MLLLLRCNSLVCIDLWVHKNMGTFKFEFTCLSGFDALVAGMAQPTELPQ